MTLYHTLHNELENHSDFWNYYDTQFDEILTNEEAAREFIFKYFKRGSKGSVLDENHDLCKQFVDTRSLHTVNVFFIGAFLQRMIDENLAIRSENATEYLFSYLWFLLCLGHDFGYKYEINSSLYISIPQKDFSPWEGGYNAVRGLKFMGRERWYKEHIIKIPYLSPVFGSRSQRRTLISDGISVQDQHIGFAGSFGDFYNDQRLHFCFEQFKIFAYISDCIASHNIYKAEVEQEDIYRRYELECLLPEQFQKISYRDNPLLFVLCVADTIEPRKRFPHYRNAELLKLISINYNVNTNVLYVEIDQKLVKHRKNADEYVTSIEQLGDWCDIETSVAVV